MTAKANTRWGILAHLGVEGSQGRPYRPERSSGSFAAYYREIAIDSGSFRAIELLPSVDPMAGPPLCDQKDYSAFGLS
jgi:hypothetical protein